MLLVQEIAIVAGVGGPLSHSAAQVELKVFDIIQNTGEFGVAAMVVVIRYMRYRQTYG